MEIEEETEEESAIRVLLRVRKMTDGERNEPERRIPCYRWNGEQIIQIDIGEEKHNFKFKYIFGEKHDNEAVFQPVKDLINYTLAGFNCTVFAYGQTGSGKTYTISGGPHKKNGLIH